MSRWLARHISLRIRSVFFQEGSPIKLEDSGNGIFEGTARGGGGVYECVGQSSLATIRHEFLIGIIDPRIVTPQNATLRQEGEQFIASWKLPPWEKYCPDNEKTNRAFSVRYPG